MKGFIFAFMILLLGSCPVRADTLVDLPVNGSKIIVPDGFKLAIPKNGNIFSMFENTAGTVKPTYRPSLTVDYVKISEFKQEVTQEYLGSVSSTIEQQLRWNKNWSLTKRKAETINGYQYLNIEGEFNYKNLKDKMYIMQSCVFPDSEDGSRFYLLTFTFPLTEKERCEEIFGRIARTFQPR